MQTYDFSGSAQSFTDTLGGELDLLLGASNADAGFKEDVRRFFQGGAPDRIEVEGHSPRTKVARLLKQLLASEPGLEIERISVRGRSGCSDFRGTVTLHTSSGTRVIDFEWCCRWRAEEHGWTDYFGFPDQGRAAREFDWRCFRTWQERTAS